MITLRKLGKSGACRVILSDDLSGVTNGSNQVFTVTYEYTPGRIEIIYDGQVLTSSVDFEETGPKEITFIYIKPTSSNVLRANYEAGTCDGLDFYFTDLEDTPSSYASNAGKVVTVNSTETGLIFEDFELGETNFISLTDTPTTYSGFENHYVKVNSTGDGLEFILPEGESRQGVENITNGVTSTAVTFDQDLGTDADDYVLTVNLENKVDVEASVYPTLIKDKTKSGFTVEFSSSIDSDNYYLNWRATLSGTGLPGGGGGSGISEIIEDTSPELGGNLEVGSNLVLLDTTPSNTTISGGNIRGYSGEASDMYVFDNPTGYACTLYMRSDGKWGPCTAISGSTHMPCAAMALETGDGGIKKILWKGIIRKGEWGWTPGQVMYVSTAGEGGITNVRPPNGHKKQAIGIAIASDTIRFDPGFYDPGE
jgi:hypothetical protein